MGGIGDYFRASMEMTWIVAVFEFRTPVTLTLFPS